MRGDGVTMRRPGLRVLVLSAVLALLAGTAVMYPYTQPALIQAKARIVGAGLTYAPLAHDDGRWSIVLTGVRSGELAWLRVAAALRPALDTHPGEEMLGAVATVLDRNPSDALRLLLPSFGAEAVCGVDEEGLPLEGSRAEHRVSLLEGQPSSAERQACLAILERLVREGTSRRTRG